MNYGNTRDLSPTRLPAHGWDLKSLPHGVIPHSGPSAWEKEAFCWPQDGDYDDVKKEGFVVLDGAHEHEETQRINNADGAQRSSSSGTQGVPAMREYSEWRDCPTRDSAERVN